MPISWNEAEPSDSSGANLGATELRSLKTTLATALSNAVYWPGSGGASAASAGLPIPGKWRAFFGLQSAVSAYADGSLYVTSDTSRLFGIGSGGTMFLGSASAIEQAVVPGAPNVRWVMASGIVAAAGGGAAVSFGVTYNGLPALICSAATTFAAPLSANPTSLSTSGATVVVYSPTGIVSGVSIHWQSLGTVSF